MIERRGGGGGTGGKGSRKYIVRASKGEKRMREKGKGNRERKVTEGRQNRHKHTD